jgi:tRNA (cmo5U34)-methyltransferase
MGAGLSLLLASEEEALMREDGFANVELFYSAFSFMGWVAKA